MTTPNTDAYMILGFALIVIIIIGYSLRLFIAYRSLRQKRDLLEEM